MAIIKSSLTKIILGILKNAEVQNLNANKIALLSKALLAIERFPKLIPWENTFCIYIKNQIEEDKLWRKISFEEDNITFGNEESLNGPYGNDGRWTLVFEHFSGNESDIPDEDQNRVAEWCELACAEISSSIENVEIEFYDYLGWDVFDSIGDAEDDEGDNDEDDNN